jgi:hypothetical protein
MNNLDFEAAGKHKDNEENDEYSEQNSEAGLQELCLSHTLLQLAVSDHQVVLQLVFVARKPPKLIHRFLVVQYLGSQRLDRVQLVHQVLFSVI